MTKDELLSIKIEAPDDNIKKAAKKKWDAVAKPIDGLGMLEEIVCRIAAVRGSTEFDPGKKALVIMCADNGIVKEGVSQTGKEVTYEVASLMGKKKSSVGIMLGDYPAEIITVDIGIDSDDIPEGVVNRKVAKGTADFLTGPAMTDDEVLRAIDAGIRTVKECSEKGISLIATGEMGIGNTTTSSALMSILTGLEVRECTGRGAGLSDEGLERKINVIDQALEFHFPEKKGKALTGKEEVFDALAKVGGLDIAGLCGVFIGGALVNVPIVIDGFISMVSALIAERLCPGCREYMIASHMGREKGMKILSGILCLNPVINADLALGEGTGAVMLFPMLDMAMSLYKSGTAFSDTPIEEYERFEKQ
ncbi:MAG: nicotinate-nucleotide--dimethylbenzimidazole phosphoribosyltransferase [Lachnospiraceae bacterium]|nr:nicotinate-nucleotide--dimethylbenzimidazole phosphoribosyltransferase [Lachnospiraceae bacterium]